MGPLSNKQHISESFELTNLIKRTRSKSVMENQDDFEEYILVCLDSTIKCTDDWIEKLNAAQEIINSLKIVDNFNDCVSYMKMVVNDKLFIVSQ